MDAARRTDGLAHHACDTSRRAVFAPGQPMARAQPFGKGAEFLRVLVGNGLALAHLETKGPQHVSPKIGKEVSGGQEQSSNHFDDVQAFEKPEWLLSHQSPDSSGNPGTSPGNGRYRQDAKTQKVGIMQFMRATLFRELDEIVGASQVLNRPEELLAYECDGLTFHRSMPDLVVLPDSTEQVSRLLKLARRYDMPFIARGSGTGLSGGATAVRGGMIIGTSRMKEIVDIDQDNRAAVVQPGVINLEVSRRVAPHGFFYAPDPSSQVACTLGGNVAENSGGPHCLKYGTTVNHILELTVVLGNGDAMRLGSAAADPPGYDLCGVFVGSEGTFGIATEIRLRLVRVTPATCTLLAAYQEVMPAIQTVTDIVAAGIVPVALEMMDRAIIQAVEDSNYRAGYPRDAGAVLLIELDGLDAGLSVREEQIRELCRNNGCTEIRVARDETERAALWRGAKAHSAPAAASVPTCT